MNFESSNFNQYEDPENNLETALDSEPEEIELNLSLEDFEQLEILRSKIDDIVNSNFNSSERFEKAKEEFLASLEEEFEEGELNQVAAVALLRGDGIPEQAEIFDLSNGYSVMDFVDSFEK